MAALAALAAAAPASSQLPPLEPRPVPTAERARIAYVAGLGLRTIAADGSDMRQVTSRGDEYGDQDPVWSPDGRSIAFVRHRFAENDEHDDDARVWIVRQDGSGARPVSTTPSSSRYESDPVWSPDGREIAFVQFKSGRRRAVTSIVAVNFADGTRRTVHTEVSGEDGPVPFFESPAWSLDGAAILFGRSTYGDGDEDPQPALHVVPAAGGEARRLIGDALHGAWSPDGGRIAYAALHDRFGATCNEEECTASGEIYVANADGSDPKRLTESRADDSEPSWSGDGQRIVFHSDRNSKLIESEESSREIYSIRPDGTCLTWLTNGTADSRSPAVQAGGGLSSDPDGCGPSAREPLVETDTRKLDAFKRFPLWWFGRVAPNGLMLNDPYLGGRLAGLVYYDCSRFDPNECGDPVHVTNWNLCASGPHLDVDGGRNRLSLFHGALLHVDGNDGTANLYTHRTRVEVQGAGGHPPPEAVLDMLRPLRGERAPGAAFPSTRLPRTTWAEVNQVAALLRRLGTAAAVGKRLHLRRSVIVQRIKLGRSLARLGVKRRLGC